MKNRDDEYAGLGHDGKRTIVHGMGGFGNFDRGT